MPRLVLDTNLLLVFIVGSIDRNLRGRAKSVKEYQPADYEILTGYVALFQNVVMTPNIVTETSNLLGQMRGDRRVRSLALMASLIAEGNECYIQSAMACVRPEYLELGITDAAILYLLDRNTYLLTNDLPLYLAAVSQGHNAQYFDELRS